MDSFVKKIDLALADKLKNDLLDQGFLLSQPPHTLFSAKKPGISLTLYSSGKLLVQGKNKQDFIAFYLEPEILKDLSFTHPETMVDLTARIGIDEAGKGDFFGPLCVAGVFADEAGIHQLIELGVRDSKRLNDKNIIPLASQIRSLFPHSLVKLFPQKYNELYEKFRNLNSMLAWAHSCAIEELVLQTGCREVIIDQFAGSHVVENAIKRKNLQISLTQRHYGEEDPVVAAASILARATFVEGIDGLSKMVEMTLPKGANSQVIAVGKTLFSKGGKDLLLKVGKMHFKTAETILNNAQDSHHS